MRRAPRTNARHQRRPARAAGAAARSALTLALALALTLGTGGAGAADGDGNYVVWGMGRASCHSFVRERGDDERYATYLMGYLTAYNALVPQTYSVSGRRDLDALLELIETHCTEHRMDSYERAIGRVLEGIAGERWKAAPAPGAGWTR